MMATDYRTVELDQGYFCDPEQHRNEGDGQQNFQFVSLDNEKNLADEERANKKRRLLTEAAKEKHRTTNRLVAQRARARIKNEIDSLRTDNAILLAQIDVMKSALVHVASLDYCTQVFEQCAIKKYELSCGRPENVPVNPPLKRVKRCNSKASVVSMSDQDDCCSSVGSNEASKETDDSNSDCTNSNDEMENCFNDNFLMNQSGFFVTHQDQVDSTRYSNENNRSHMVHLKEEVDHGYVNRNSSTQPPFKYVREDSFGSRVTNGTEHEHVQSYFYSDYPQFQNGRNNQRLNNGYQAENSKSNNPPKKPRGRQPATNNTTNTRALLSQHQQPPQQQQYYQSGHVSPICQELVQPDVPRFTQQRPSGLNVTCDRNPTSPKLPLSPLSVLLPLVSKSQNGLSSLSCSSNSVEIDVIDPIDSAHNDWVVDFFGTNFLTGDNLGDNIE